MFLQRSDPVPIKKQRSSKSAIKASCTCIIGSVLCETRQHDCICQPLALSNRHDYCRSIDHLCICKELQDKPDLKLRCRSYYHHCCCQYNPKCQAVSHCFGNGIMQSEHERLQDENRDLKLQVKELKKALGLLREPLKQIINIVDQ